MGPTSTPPSQRTTATPTSPQTTSNNPQIPASPPQLPLQPLAVLISSTYRLLFPHPNARLSLNIELGHRQPTATSTCPTALPCTCNQRRRRTHWLHCLQLPPPTSGHSRNYFPASLEEPVLSLSTWSPQHQPSPAHPAPAPASSAGIQSQCPPQLPAPTLTTSHTHFTNEATVVSSPKRSPIHRQRTWPPPPHRRLHSRQPSLPCNQRRRRTHWLHCLHCHHPRPATHQLHSSVPEEPVPSLPSLPRTRSGRPSPGR